MCGFSLSLFYAFLVGEGVVCLVFCCFFVVFCMCRFLFVCCFELLFFLQIRRKLPMTLMLSDPSVFMF